MRVRACGWIVLLSLAALACNGDRLVAADGDAESSAGDATSTSEAIGSTGASSTTGPSTTGPSTTGSTSASADETTSTGDPGAGFLPPPTDGETVSFECNLLTQDC